MTLPVNGYVTFSASPFGSGAPKDPGFQPLTILCGEKPPTVTGGYSKWNVIERPLTRSATVFAGYDPAALSIDLRFGVWDGSGWGTGEDAGNTVENRIREMEWMAGVKQTQGPPPAVTITSRRGDNSTSDLIPHELQGYTWVVQGLDWGKALRNRQGSRIFQEATVSLLAYLGFQSAPSEPNSATVQSGAYTVSKPGRDTPLLIAGAPLVSGDNIVVQTDSVKMGAAVQALARAIVSDSHNQKLKLRSVNSKIKHGTKVWVPQRIGG